MRKKHATAPDWPLRFVADADVAAINPGYDTKKGQSYPFVSMDDVRDECRGIASFGTRPLDSSGYTVFRNGDTIFAKITPCTENGKIALVPELPGEIGLGSTEFIVLSPGALILPEFLYFQLIRGDVRALCASLMEGSTGRQRVPTSIFRKRVRIPVPKSLDEQRAVATALAMFDSSITATQAAIAAVERLQQGLMRELLAGQIRADGTARSAKDFWAHDRLGNVPHGWQVARLRDIFRLKNGKSNITANLRATRESAFCHPVYGGNGMTGWSDRFFLSEPTVVIGRVGEYCGAIHATPPESWVTDNALYVEERLAPLDIRYLFHLLTSLRLNRWKATTGQPKITQSETLNIRVAFPEDEDEQRAIADRLAAFHDLIQTKDAKITALQRLKKSLMQNLLTGRKRLSPELIAALNADPVDEKSGGA